MPASSIFINSGFNALSGITSGAATSLVFTSSSNPGFANSIRSNLKREKPYPFLVAAQENKVVGWTGAMYTESTGRGHLDGICVDPNVRGGGLGKGLFCNLCYWLKQNGSSYMTFFTGIDNPARYIYLSAGFKIAQSFADMKKNF